MEKGMSFWGVLVIMVIVAAIASLVTVSVTGNIIKDAKNDSDAETYTKAEINLMLDELSESLANEKDSNSLLCDLEGVCEINELLAEGEVKLASLSDEVSPFKTDNVYVCVDKQGKLYRGTSSGCR
jgi:hypothetical protein